MHEMPPETLELPYLIGTMSSPNIKDLLLAPRLDREQVSSLLRPYGIKEPDKGGCKSSMDGK